MVISINCRELGIDCDFAANGESNDAVIEMLMRHVNDVHAEDWFEAEEIYRAATTKVREKAA
jgi:predicted small metal-binding protein